MSLSINQYSSWALQNAGNEVALGSGQGNPSLDRASNQVNVFARFFGTDAAKATRSAVMKDFTRALSSRFGTSLAQSVLAEAGLTRTSKLTGQTISAVIDRATHLQAAALANAASSDLRLTTGTITQATIGGLDPQTKARAKNYSQLRMIVIDTLGEMPLDADSLADFRTRVSIAQNALAPFRNMQLPGAAAAISGDATSLHAALAKKLQEATALLAGQPLSDRNISDFKDVWASAALATLNSLQANAGSGSNLEAAIMSVQDLVRDNIGTGNQDDLMLAIPVSQDVQKELAKHILDLIKKTAPAEAGKLSEDAITKELGLGYRKTLNSRPWPVIDKTFTASVGAVPIELKSTIVPGAQIGRQPNDEKGPIGNTYDNGVNGYMCHSADTDHAVNLAVSSLTVPDKGTGQPQLAFQGIRHGVHCAWELTDPNQRQQANTKRAQESVIAAFLANPANMQAVMQEAQRTGFTDSQGMPLATFDMNMTSISLLTPDSARHTFQKGSASDERQMLIEQKAAWDEVSQKGVEFTFQQGGRSYHVHIQPTVTTFNFGVNAGAVKWSSIAPTKAGGWDVSDSLNSSALTAMDQAVQNFAATHPGDPKARIAQELFQQCRDVTNVHGERRDDHDAYKVAARMAVLTHLIGGTPCWNCKSGKDRTGEMDVECKFLATLIARGEDIPKPGDKLTTEQTALFRAIALESGNFEMQKLNTGFAGYKTGGVASIPERLGGKDVREFHAGGSEFVKV